MDYGPNTALVVVDCQNDFADPEGSLYVNRGEDVIQTCNREIAAATAAGAPVIYTQDWHPDSTPHFEKDGGIWPVHCVAATWGADFHPELIVSGPSVKKGANGEDGYSGFTMRDPETGEETATELDTMIRDRGSTHVVVVGLALDYCVKATALDAVGNGYATTVIDDATAAVNLEPDHGDQARTKLAEAGVALV